jgi:hypothetical protein
LTHGVIGNTSDFDSAESWFEPRWVNIKSLLIEWALFIFESHKRIGFAELSAKWRMGSPKLAEKSFNFSDSYGSIMIESNNTFSDYYGMEDMTAEQAWKLVIIGKFTTFVFTNKMPGNETSGAYF